MAIDVDALLASLLSIELLGCLGIQKHLPLKLSLFSTRINVCNCGSLNLSHFYMILDSWMASPSFNLRILAFLSLFRVCCLIGPMFFQHLLRVLSRGLMCLGSAPPHTVKHLSRWQQTKLSYISFASLRFNYFLCLHSKILPFAIFLATIFM